MRSCLVPFAGALACVFAFHGFAALAASDTIVYSFQNNGGGGTYPAAGLIDVKGTLYGTTVSGGDYDQGTIFGVNTTTGVGTVLHTFCSNGRTCKDGAYPYANLVEVKGVLYGTTLDGGDYGTGTVFSLDLASGTETVVHSFGGSGDGNSPYAAMVAVDGTLYGTTASGGATGDGTVFSLDPKTGTESVLYSFCGQQNCADGVSPQGSLIAVNGTLYGTTQYGGVRTGSCSPWGCGTVFALDPTGDAESTVYSFCSQEQCADGANPYAGLLYVKSTLYGTTQYGGTYNQGTVFSVDPTSGIETVLHSFQSGSGDGVVPTAGLIKAKNRLYGTTSQGGTYGGGIVFSLDRKTGAEAVLHDFAGGSDGRTPEGKLVSVHGTLFGTTEYGGAYSEGAIFSLMP